MKLEYLPPCDAPECPLIRLYGQHQPDFVSLRGALVAMAESGRPVFLHELAWIEAIDGVGLTLRLHDRDQGIRRVASNDFQLGLRSDTWTAMAELVKPFIDSPSGFQWLDSAYHGLGPDDIGFLLSGHADGTW